MGPERTATPSPRSLFRMLADGTAGAGTRVVVSLSAALLMSALACIGAFLLSIGIHPNPWPGSSRRFVRVSEDMLAICFLMAGILYLGMLFWIWSRHRRKRGLWMGAIASVGILLLAILISVWIGETVSGDSEVLISGVMIGAFGLVMLIWTRLYHRHVGGRALYDQSGTLDLRCPSCGYSMVGLREARCPECGQEYTLNDLLGRQDFEVLRLRRMLAGQDESTVLSTPSKAAGRAEPTTV